MIRPLIGITTARVLNNAHIHVMSVAEAYVQAVYQAGGLPLLNFPEISMWGNWPWGGVGANPLPARFQRLWDQVQHAVQGGFPYSEGIYEDMNKAVVAQFYWDAGRSARAAPVRCPEC